VRTLMRFEPAAGGEVGGDAGGQQEEADGDSGEDPTGSQASLRDEAVEQRQDEHKDGGFGKEGAAAMGRDGDEIDDTGGGWLRGGRLSAT